MRSLITLVLLAAALAGCSESKGTFEDADTWLDAVCLDDTDRNNEGPAFDDPDTDELIATDVRRCEPQEFTEHQFGFTAYEFDEDPSAALVERVEAFESFEGESMVCATKALDDDKWAVVVTYSYENSDPPVDPPLDPLKDLGFKVGCK